MVMAIRIAIVMTGMNIGMTDIAGMTGGMTGSGMNARSEDGGGVRRNGGGTTIIITIEAVSI